MSALIQPPDGQAVVYPESDGKPMADNTKQYEWIVTIKGGLDAFLPNDFAAGDLLWYPVEGNPKIRQAPDVMVAIGRPKGHRGSYLQWQEEGVAPQVVFEILSPGNTFAEMTRKQQFYERHGVEEYYVYDPDHVELVGYLRDQGQLRLIDNLDGWVSPRLGIRFEMKEELELYHLDGQKFATFMELTRQRDSERQRAEQAEAKAERLAEQLRTMGIEPDRIEI